MSELTITTSTGFSLMQNVAKSFASSDMVPESYKGKPANVVIALDLANRLGMAPLMVMQNLHIIKGRPAWSSQFIIASINQSGKYTPLRFEFSGSGDDRTCFAWAHSKDDGARVAGPSVNIKMAKDEGWWNKPDKFGKNTSKWPTMTDLMLTYRAAAFFGRTYCPEMLMGVYEENEIHDFAEEKNTPKSTSHHVNHDIISAKEIKEVAIIEESVEPPQVKKPKMSQKQIEQLVGKIKDNCQRLTDDPLFEFVYENHKLFENARKFFDVSEDELSEIFANAEMEYQSEIGG